MIAIRMSATRVPISRIASRGLSTQTTQAVDKLRLVFEEYRQQNYTQEHPRRFKKEILQAAASQSADHGVAMDGLQRVLHNIGAQHRVADQDLQAIFAEVANSETGEIPAQEFVQQIL